ncbi:MAG TPA: response regulator transcription factor [Terriglobia bacterium]|nr:response regulator transcription factor [Terriglobia bacterium]
MEVFIVDDSSMVVERLLDIIRRVHGLEFVGLAAHASAAIQSIAKIEPDVVILDVHILGGSGIDVLKAVKESLPFLKVIVLTSFPSPQLRKRCMALGADYFLDKSTDFGKLPEIFRDMMRGKAA